MAPKAKAKPHVVPKSKASTTARGDGTKAKIAVANKKASTGPPMQSRKIPPPVVKPYDPVKKPMGERRIMVPEPPPSCRTCLQNYGDLEKDLLPTEVCVKWRAGNWKVDEEGPYCVSSDGECHYCWDHRRRDEPPGTDLIKMEGEAQRSRNECDSCGKTQGTRAGRSFNRPRGDCENGHR